MNMKRPFGSIGLVFIACLGATVFFARAPSLGVQASTIVAAATPNPKPKPKTARPHYYELPISDSKCDPDNLTKACTAFTLDPPSFGPEKPPSCALDGHHKPDEPIAMGSTVPPSQFPKTVYPLNINRTAGGSINGPSANFVHGLAKKSGTAPAYVVIRFIGCTVFDDSSAPSGRKDVIVEQRLYVPLYSDLKTYPITLVTNKD